MEQAIDLTHPNGFVGALVPWTYTFLSTLEKLRTEVLCGEARPEFIQEYGYGILDGATVGTVATVARKLSGASARSVLEHPCVFDRLSEQKKDWQKQEKFLGMFPKFVAAGPNPELDWFVARLRSLKDVPGMPYAYWASNSLRALFRNHTALDSENAFMISGRPHGTIAPVRQGLAIGASDRFVRFWWECWRLPSSPTEGWVPFSKDGRQVRFYSRIDLVLDWRSNGRDLRVWADTQAGGRVINEAFYFRPGITWSAAGWRLSRFGRLSGGHIFGHKGPSIFPNESAIGSLLGILNSRLGSIMMLMQTPERDWNIKMVASLPILFVPVHSDTLGKISDDLTARVQETSHIGDETCRDFLAPDLLQLFTEQRDIDSAAKLEIASLLSVWLTERKVMVEEEARLLRELDEEAYRLYEISSEDRTLIERELARRPKSESGYSAAELASTNGEAVASDADDSDDIDQTEDNTDPEEAEGEAEVSDGVLTEVTPDRARDLVARFVSYYLKQTLEADQDGIVPVAPTHGEPGLIIRLRETMTRDLGEATAQALEAQAPAYLGTEDLAEWLAISREETREVNNKKQKSPLGFFPWHVTLYRNRPIFWLLSSENFEKGKTRFTFRAFIHYLNLTPDTLLRLMTYYLDPALDWANGEWNRVRDEATRLEGRAQKVANAATQEWLNTVDALKRFRAALESVIQGPPRAERVPENAKWLPRTIAQVRGGQDLGHGYQPDIDHGVRVNIIPLVEAKLFPRVVLKRLGG